MNVMAQSPSTSSTLTTDQLRTEAEESQAQNATNVRPDPIVLITEDLARSGLVPDDINARRIDNTERAAAGVPHSTDGYVIPYYTLTGKSAGFYRLRLFDYTPKYKQPRETQNHVYFPRGFKDLADQHNYVLIVEGEKKAALACKLGIPAIAFGGVDSWKSRSIVLPNETELKPRRDGKKIQAKLPAGHEGPEDGSSTLAVGFQDLVDYCVATQKSIVIVYDVDASEKAATSVQRAAALLGFELRFLGVPFNKIKQLSLPLPPTTTPTIGVGEKGRAKIGLDDYLVQHGASAFYQLLTLTFKKRNAFPRHPNIRDYINKRLQRSRMSRKEMQQVSIAILSELDADGVRLWSTEEAQAYYFDLTTHKLIRVSFTGQVNELTESMFGHLLYQKFGVGAADFKVVQWLGTQFTGEPPIEHASPYRVLARPKINENSVTLQISDGQYVVVTSEGIQIKDNGSDNILFESGHVKGMDIEAFKEAFKHQSSQPPQPWWMDVLSQVRLRDKDRQRCVTAMMFYISPWLYRWRGTQLPIEMTLGEAGSGKSTLQELRLSVLTGIPKLRNAPTDLKDWHASISNVGGLHVTDNLQFADKGLRQRLSDEICRIITEPQPTIEMRKYYTNAEIISIPIRCTFGITAIQQPFLNADILQRAFIIELDKSQDLMNGSLAYDATWMQQQLNRFGGREAWVAHHCAMLMFFFRLAERKWNLKYQAKSRLINLEQALCLMAEVFNISSSWIPDYLVSATDRSVTDADWAFEGLQAFVAWWRTFQQMPDKLNPKKTTYKAVTVQDISEWAQMSDEYTDCEMLTNSRRLGRYLKTHKTLVASAAKLVEDGTTNNRTRYKLL